MVKKNMDKGLQILFDTYFGKYGWKDGTISEKDFKIAKKEGYMFDYPKSLTHEETYQKLEEILKYITKEKVSNAFLASLVTRKLEYRSALASYWYVISIPKHEKGETESSCGYCHWTRWYEVPNDYEKKHGVNVLNAERYRWGGVRHGQLRYALFDLEEFLKLPVTSKEEVDEGKKLLLKILHCIDDLDGTGKVGKYRNYLVKQKLIKSNRSEIDILLDILGVSGILTGEEGLSYYESYTPAAFGARDPKEHTNDFIFPVNRWRVRDGVNKKMFKLVFGFDYE